MDEGFRANRGVSVQVSEDRRRKTDVRSRMTEVRRQRSDDRRPVVALKGYDAARR